MRRPRLILAILAAGAGLAAVATAAVKPESAIAYRQAGYTMLGWNFGPMAQMVRGKTPWDAAEFARIVGLAQARDSGKHVERFVGVRVAGGKDERNAPPPQVFRCRKHHLARQVDVEHRDIRRIVRNLLERLREARHGADHLPAKILDGRGEVLRDQELVFHNEDAHAPQACPGDRALGHGSMISA